MKKLACFALLCSIMTGAQAQSNFSKCDSNKTINKLLATNEVQAVLRKSFNIESQQIHAVGNNTIIESKYKSLNVRQYSVGRKINIVGTESNNGSPEDILLANDKSVKQIFIPAKIGCRVLGDNYKVIGTYSGPCPKYYKESDEYATEEFHNGSYTIAQLNSMLNDEVIFQCKRRAVIQD